MRELLQDHEIHEKHEQFIFRVFSVFRGSKISLLKLKHRFDQCFLLHHLKSFLRLVEGKDLADHRFVLNPDTPCPAAQRVPDSISTVEQVTDLLARQLEGISIVGHPLSHTNVNGIPSIAAIVQSSTGSSRRPVA